MTECWVMGPTGKPCGRRTEGAWHIGLDVPACEVHAPRGVPGQKNPSPCCGYTMDKFGKGWKCPCGYLWSDV